MRQWAEDYGIFIPLDDYYESITFIEPSQPGFAGFAEDPAVPVYGGSQCLQDNTGSCLPHHFIKNFSSTGV